MRFYRRPLFAAALLTAAVAMPAQSATVSEAQSLLDQGLYKKALDQATALVNANGGDDQARFVQAAAQARLGQNAAAIENFAALANKHPNSPEPANNLAVLYAKQGDYEKARRWLESAMATHPAYATAHRNLGDVYTALAAVAYSRALDQEQSSDLGVDLELVNSFMGDSGKSPTALAQAARSQPAAPAQPRPVQPAPATEPYRLPQGQQQAAAQPSNARPAPVPATPAPATAPAAPTQPPVAAAPPAAAPAQPPAAPAAAPSSPSGDPRQTIVAAVNAWAAAWESQDVDGYLNSYGDNFYPGDGMSLAQWKQQRRDRVGKPGDISVRVIQPEVTLQGQDRASVTFRQAYESYNYSDQVRKTLEMQRKPGGWKIVREISQSL